MAILLDKAQTIYSLSNSEFPFSEVTFEKGDVICQRHQKIEHFRVLLEGRISYYSEKNVGTEEVLIIDSDLVHMPIGWNGIVSPGRFMSKIEVSSKTARFLEFDIEALRTFIKDEKNFEILRDVSSKLNVHYRSIVSAQKAHRTAPKHNSIDARDTYSISSRSSVEEVAKLLKCSPFLEQLSDQHLKKIASLSTRRDYLAGEQIFIQDQETDGFYVLIQGDVSIVRNEEGKELMMRSISTPAFVFGWSAILNGSDFCSASATHNTSVYHISIPNLLNEFKTDREFGYCFYERLIWLIGNQIQVASSRLYRLMVGHDQLAVLNLIESNRSKLLISSHLHKVPHLLQNPLTMSMGFDLLHQLNQSGNPLERHLASVSLDLLKGNKKELKFLEDLEGIYRNVAENVDELAEDEIRRSCSIAVKQLFTNVNYQIVGWENLPNDTGHIFIYNHLLNDPYYTLANNFQITLDSHFISSLILDEKYQDPGMRIVRIGNGVEYGHQNYYHNLGYINVQTKDSPATDNKTAIRKQFYELAGKCLVDRKNLIISPEGVSHTTEESPGMFKMGAFKLALKQKNEPLIVPIVMSNFDKRIIGHKFSCKILKPFKLSSKVRSEEELPNYLNELRTIFKSEINSINA